MFDFFRDRQMMTTAAFAVMILTIADVGACLADKKKNDTDTKTDISVKNELGVDVVIKFSGDPSLEKLNPYTFRGTSSEHKVGSVSEGTTVKWEATLADKTVCKGDKKAAGLKTTLTISKDKCTAPPAASTPRPPSAPNSQAAKTPATTAGGSLSIRFSNVTSQSVLLHVKDLGNPGDTSPLRSEISPGLTSEGKISGAKNYFDYSAKTDKDGKYRLEISWSCAEGGGGGNGIYKDKEIAAAIVNPKDADKKAKNECRLTGMHKE